MLSGLSMRNLWNGHRILEVSSELCKPHLEGREAYLGPDRQHQPREQVQLLEAVPQAVSVALRVGTLPPLACHQLIRLSIPGIWRSFSASSHQHN